MKLIEAELESSNGLSEFALYTKALIKRQEGNDIETLRTDTLTEALKDKLCMADTTPSIRSNPRVARLVSASSCHQSP